MGENLRLLGFFEFYFLDEFEGHGVCIVLTPCFGVMDVSDVLRDICSARAPDAMGGREHRRKSCA